MKKLIVEVDDVVYSLLEVLARGPSGLGSVEGVVHELIDHAQQGVYRPGAWERDWLTQAFGSEFVHLLEPGDPYGREGCESVFMRPTKA